MGKRTSQLNEITTIDNNDILYGVDVDDLTHSPDGTSKKFTKQNLLKEINSRAGDIESDVSDLESAVANILNLVYPVGSIYTNATDDTNPGTLLGVGTWEAFGQGRVMVGKASSGTFATAGATGGAETHTLTTTEMPSHTHAQYVSANPGTGGPGIRVDYNRDASGASAYFQGISTGSAGSGNAHNNLQPYIVVYMWKRTA